MSTDDFDFDSFFVAETAPLPPPVVVPVATIEPAPVEPVAIQPPPEAPQAVVAGAPALLPCGHLYWTGEAPEGSCCPRGGQTNAPRRWRLGSVEIVPSSQRRESGARAKGWPGYCCDEAGKYIGGLGNDCRYYGPAGQRCKAHR